jgi:hypothetical protein
LASKDEMKYFITKKQWGRGLGSNEFYDLIDDDLFGQVEVEGGVLDSIRRDDEFDGSVYWNSCRSLNDIDPWNML